MSYMNWPVLFWFKWEGGGGGERKISQSEHVLAYSYVIKDSKCE